MKWWFGGLKKLSDCTETHGMQLSPSKLLCHQIRADRFTALAKKALRLSAEFA